MTKPTWGDFIKRLQGLKNKEEAASLLEEEKTNPNTWSNILYVTGYLGNEERNRILSLFK